MQTQVSIPNDHTIEKRYEGKLSHTVWDWRRGKRFPCRPCEELEGLRKGDIVRVKGKYIKQINSIYSNGYVAFKRVKGEPYQARPQDCHLLEKERTLLWEKVA